MKRKALFIFLLLIIPLSSVSAHQPIWGDVLGPIEIDGIITSYAFYQTLQADEVDVFYFEGKKGDNFRAGIQVPDIPALENYGVTIALFVVAFVFRPTIHRVVENKNQVFKAVVFVPTVRHPPPAHICLLLRRC